MWSYKVIGATGIFIINAMLFGCEVPVQKPVNGKAGIENGISLDNRFEQTDSIVVVFYKDPFGADSLRYTRYYTQVTSTGMEDIAIMLEQLKGEFLQEEKRDNCRNEGKIWCFAGGKVFQTLYFNTSCDHCCHVLLLKNGNYYYGIVSNSFSKWLAGKKILTKEPASLTTE